MKVIDFDCGDYFTVVIIETGEYEFDAQMYRDFKYSSNQKIIMKIIENKQKKENTRMDSIANSSSSSVESVFKNKGLYTLDGEINTKYVRSYILRKNMVFNFNKAVVRKKWKKGEKITLENLEEKVRDFFGVIDFTQLPVHLLSLEEPVRRRNLKSEIKKTVEDLCDRSKDFKEFMKNFNRALRLSNADPNINFDEMFYKEILKEKIIKRVMPKYKKRDKKERKFYYRKGEKVQIEQIDEELSDNSKFQYKFSS